MALSSSFLGINKIGNGTITWGLVVEEVAKLPFQDRSDPSGLILKVE